MLESLFNKVAALRTPKQVFSCEYCEIFKNTFLRNTSSGCFWINTGDTRNTDNPFTHTIWAWNKSLAMAMNLLLHLIMPLPKILLRESKPLFRWNTLFKNNDFNKNKIQVDRWSREYRNKICFWKFRIYKWNR